MSKLTEVPGIVSVYAAAAVAAAWLEVPDRASGAAAITTAARPATTAPAARTLSSITAKCIRSAAGMERWAAGLEGAPPPSKQLELEAQAQLNVALARLVGDAAEVPARRIGFDTAEVRVVEEVEGFCAEL